MALCLQFSFIGGIWRSGKLVTLHQLSIGNGGREARRPEIWTEGTKSWISGVRSLTIVDAAGDLAVNCILG